MSTSLNARQYTLSPTGDGPLALAAGNQLMTLDAPGTPVSPGERFLVAQNAAGQPLIFSLGSDHRPWLIVPDASAAAGYRQIDLAARLLDAEGEAVVGQAVGLWQDPATRALSLALAVATSATDRTSRLYATQPLSPDTTDWDDFSGWTEHSGGDPADGWVVDLIRMGPGNGNTPGLLIGVEGSSRASYFSVDLSPATSQPWYEMPPPSDADDILDLVVGQIGALGAGFYMLYRNGATTLLRFSTFPVDTGSSWIKPVNRPLTAPADALCLAVGPLLPDGTPFGSTELFVGRDGVQYYAPDDQAQHATGVLLSGSARPSPTTELVVATDAAGHTALWVLGQDATLGYSLRAADAQGPSFPDLQPLVADASQIAALRNDARSTDQLFYVSTSSELRTLARDPDSGLWQLGSIATADTGSVVSQNGFAYQLQFSAGGAALPADFGVSVTASGWSQATVNGASRTFDSTHPLELSPDNSGLLTIIFPTATLDLPSLTLTSAAFSDTIVLDGGADIRARLLAMSAEQWGSATYPQGPNAGSLVVGSDYQGNIDAAVGLLGQLSQTADELSASGGDAAALARVRRPRHGQVVAVVKDETGARYVEGAEAQALFAAAQRRHALKHGLQLDSDDGALAAIEVAAGDMLNWLMQGVEAVADVFLSWIEDAVWMVVEIAGTLFRFALKALSVVWRAFSWVLEDLLGLTLAALLLFAGFFMDWDAITRVQQVMANLLRQVLLFTRDESAALGATIDQALGQLEQQLGSLGPLNDPAADHGLVDSAQSTAAEHPDTSQAGTSDPAVGYSGYHLRYSGALDADLPTPSNGPLETLLTDVIFPPLASAAQTLAGMWQDFVTGLQAGASFNDLLLQLGTDAVVGVVDAIRTALAGLLDSVADIIDGVLSVLDSELHIPFFTPLFELWLPDESASLLNILALLCAIPLTPLSKLVLGSTPFPDGTYNLTTAGWQELTGLGGAQQLLARPARTELDVNLSDKGCAWWYSHLGALAGGALSSILAVLNAAKAWQVGILRTLEEDGQAASDAAKSAKKKTGVIGGFSLFLSWGRLAAVFPVDPPANAGLQYINWCIGVTSALLQTFGLLPFPGHKDWAAICGMCTSTMSAADQGVIALAEFVEDPAGIGSQLLTLSQNWCNQLGGIGIGYSGLPLPGKAEAGIGGAGLSILGDLLLLARLAIGDIEKGENFYQWATSH